MSSDASGTDKGMSKSDFLVYSSMMLIFAIPMGAAMSLASGFTLYGFKKILPKFFKSKPNSNIPSVITGCLGLVVATVGIVFGILIVRKLYFMSDKEQKKRWFLIPTGMALTIAGFISLFITVILIKDDIHKPKSITAKKRGTEKKTRGPSAPTQALPTASSQSRPEKGRETRKAQK